ncbi:MAG: hypothetical protein Q4F39_02015 [Bacteroidia bacterium]|nr:hypothetical protein [Bacteroidia bacterium]
MKRLAYIISSVLLIAGCVKVENTVPDLIKVDDKVNVTFSVKLPEAVDETKAFGDNPTIDNMYIAVFDKGGMLTEYVRAESAPYANVNSSITDGIGSPEFTYTATLSVSDYPCILHFIANGPSPSELTYGSETEVLNSKAFIDSYGQERYWQRVQVPSIKKDAQSDEADLTTTALLSHIALIRNFAKITVSANAPHFTLVGFYTMNTMDKGMTAAYNRNTGKFIEEYQNYSAEELINMQYNANVPITASLKSGLSDLFEVDAAGIGTSYLFEREKPKADPTYVIVAGKYTGDGHDQSITSPTYYKIDLRDEDKNYFPFLRNFNYQINIYNVNRDGRATPEEAAASASSSPDISTSIEAKDLTNISDGTSRMFVDYTEMVLIGNNDCIFRYKYIPDLSWGDSDGVAKIFNGNDYIALSLEDPGTNGHALTDVFDVAAEDDADGYRKVTVHPTEVTDAIKTSVVRIVGSYPGGQTQHDGKTVDISPIQRNISFMLRDSLALQVSCNPADIEKKIGEDISVFIKIEDGLSSSIFSLDFYVEVKELSLTSDELPVRNKASIIPGNTEPAFQFLKTITWAEYEAATADEYGYKTFECKFKSNIAESASAIYVYNPYFHLGKTEFGNFNLKRFSDLAFSRTANVHEGDSETFSFKVGNLPETGSVIATLYNLEPSADETKMTRIKANGDGSVDYEIDVEPNSTTSLDLVVNDYDGYAKVILNADEYAEATSPLVQILQAKFSNPVWSGKPMNAGSELTFTFKMSAAPQTNAKADTKMGRAIVVLTNAKPDSSETHLEPVPGETNTYYYTPYGTDNDSVAEATQTIKLTAIEKDAVTIKVSADHFDAPNPLQSRVAPLDPLDTPTIIEGAVTAKTLTVSWNAVSGATGYTVYIQGASASEPINLDSSTTSYKFTGLDPEGTYMVCLIAKGDDSTAADSDLATKDITTHSQKKLAPVITEDEDARTSSSLKFNWSCGDYNNNVQGYQVYWDSTTNLVQTGDRSLTSYTATGLSRTSTHTIYVVAVGDDDEYLDSDMVSQTGTTKNAEKLDTPSVYVYALSNDYLKFAWEPVANATGYEASVDGGKTYTSLGNSTSCQWNRLRSNTSYTIYVRAVSSNSNYDTSDAGTCTASTNNSGRNKLGTPVIISVDATPTTATVIWEENPDASYYEISTNANFSNSKTTTGTDYTLTGLNPNSSYTVYVRARTYNSYNNADSDTASRAFNTPAKSAGDLWNWTGSIKGTNSALDGSQQAIANAKVGWHIKVTYTMTSLYELLVGGEYFYIYTGWHQNGGEELLKVSTHYSNRTQTYEFTLTQELKDKISGEAGMVIKTSSNTNVTKVEIIEI